MDDTRDIDRTVLRIITVAGTARCTSGTAVGLPLRYCWRPEDFDITVRAMRRLLCMPHTLTIMVL